MIFTKLIISLSLSLCVTLLNSHVTLFHFVMWLLLLRDGSTFTEATHLSDQDLLSIQDSLPVSRSSIVVRAWLIVSIVFSFNPVKPSERCVAPPHSTLLQKQVHGIR